MYLHGLRRLRSFKWQNRAICSCMMAQVKSPWLLLHSVEKFIRDYVLALFFFLKKIHTRLFWRCFAWKNSYETMFGAVFPGKIHTRLCLVLFCLEKFIRDYVWCCFAWKNSYETMYWCCFSWKNSYETMFWRHYNYFPAYSSLCPTVIIIIALVHCCLTTKVLLRLFFLSAVLHPAEFRLRSHDLLPLQDRLLLPLRREVSRAKVRRQPLQQAEHFRLQISVQTNAANPAAPHPWLHIW